MTDTSINEFDILTVVVNCSPPRYIASLEKRIQELIVINISKQTLTFTIWEEEIIEHEGTKLLQQFRQYPTILARRIGASKYNGVSLTTKFNTTIQIDPPYPQRRQLKEWSQKINRCLLHLPAEGQKFSLEATITFSVDPKNLYVLRKFTNKLRIRVNMDLWKMFKQSFNKKLFSVRAKKSFARTSRTTPIKLYIQSCVKKQSPVHSLAPSATMFAQEGSKRKQQTGPLQLTEEAESLKMKQKLEPDTPQKGY